MKPKFSFLTLLLFCACTNVNKPLTDADKDKVIGEVKGVIGTVVQVCENPNPEKLKSIYLESPDFVSLVGGVCSDYEQSLKGMYAYFSIVSSQKSTIRNEKFMVLDAATVLYSANSRWEVKMKNDSTVVMDPLGMQFLFKKIDNQWRILSWTESIK